MFPNFRQAMTWLHTWLGLVLGFVLMAAFFFGALSVFDREIDRWAIPAGLLAGRSGWFQHAGGQSPAAGRDDGQGRLETLAFWGFWVLAVVHALVRSAPVAQARINPAWREQCRSIAVLAVAAVGLNWLTTGANKRPVADP